MKKSILMLALGAAFQAGCSSDSGQMKKGDEDQLKSNLTSPVDVEKVRAEYAKEKGTETGKASGEQ